MCQFYIIFWLLLRVRNHQDQRISVYNYRNYSLHANFFQLSDQNWQQRRTWWVSSCSQSWSMLTNKPTETWLRFPFHKDSSQYKLYDLGKKKMHTSKIQSILHSEILWFVGSKFAFWFLKGKQRRNTTFYPTVCHTVLKLLYYCIVALLAEI